MTKKTHTKTTHKTTHTKTQDTHTHLKYCRKHIAVALVLAIVHLGAAAARPPPQRRAAAATTPTVAATSSPWPPTSSLPSLRSAVTPTISVRRATPADVDALAQLCTDAFYGTHTFFDGPVIFAQREAILARVRSQVRRRISLDDDREAQLLVATAPENRGRVVGCIDLAVHIFDRQERRFELTRDELPPGGGYCWKPYVASVAVAPGYRRRGIARLLVGRAERLALGWGYHDICLEVSATNVGAISLYQQAGYRIVGSDTVGGVQSTEIEVVAGFWWRELSDIPKYVLRKRLRWVL